MVDGKAVALGIPGRGTAASATNLPDTPLGRPGTPEEGAKAILFLISPLASYVRTSLQSTAALELMAGPPDLGPHVRRESASRRARN